MRPRDFFALIARPERHGTLAERRLSRCLSVEDLRQEARRYLPRAVFDYVDGGTEDEMTLRRNREAFAEIDIVARVLRDVSRVDLRTEILGTTSALPLALGPTGATRTFRSEGELAVARAASDAGIPYALSTGSTNSIEDVADAAAGGPLWFQLYVFTDRGLAREHMARARSAGYRALIVTVDCAAIPIREREARRGFAHGSIAPRVIADGLHHPRWSAQFLRGRPLSFPNLTAAGGDGSARDAGLVMSTLDTGLQWADVAWIASEWNGPIAVKGILSVEDAREAAAAGVTGIVVSNHGGRALDGTPATIDVVGDIADAVGSELEVLLDSGVRRGTDVVRALALGARACLVGRAYLYGLAAGGQAGVARAIQLLTGEIQRGLALAGAATPSDLDGAAVRKRRPDTART